MIYNNTQHALHTPSACALTHWRARSPSRFLVKLMFCFFFPKWTSIEFPTASICDIARPNMMHLKWKGRMVLRGNKKKKKHPFKGHCCCFGCVSTLRRRSSVWVWYPRTKVVAQGEVWCCTLQRQQGDTDVMWQLSCVPSAQFSLLSSLFVLYGNKYNAY